MLNKIQEQDSKKCEEMQSIGKDMECFGCSCSVCLAQQPNHYKIGLKKAISIIEKEVEFAKTVNPQMAMGMNQVKMLIEKELK